MSEVFKSIIPASLIPAGVKDSRQEALIQIFGEALARINLDRLIMVDPLTVDARLLPYMIREFAAQEFIDADLPEYVQRRILKNIWGLKSLHGYDAGVRLGLSLLGMQMVLKHWHQETPKGPPNTHIITFLVGETFFDEGVVLGPRIIAAAERMIAATKRLSQHSTIRIGVNMQRALPLVSGAAPLEVLRSTGAAKRPSSFLGKLGVVSAASEVSILRPTCEAQRPSAFTSKVGVTASVSILEINRISARAA